MVSSRNVHRVGYSIFIVVEIFRFRLYSCSRMTPFGNLAGTETVVHGRGNPLPRDYEPTGPSFSYCRFLSSEDDRCIKRVFADVTRFHQGPCRTEREKWTSFLAFRVMKLFGAEVVPRQRSIQTQKI